VRRKATRLSRILGWQREAREELEQQLLADLVPALRSYDSAQGRLSHFVQKILSRKAANFLRYRKAERRDVARTVSFQDLIADDSRTPLSAEVQDGSGALSMQRGILASNEIRRYEMMHDVATLTTSLGKAERDLVGLLMRGLSCPEIARKLGVPRTTIQSRIARLRKPFEDCGLREYLA
jgi:RNA polymerase sigma factor (sigma-70 family)